MHESLWIHSIFATKIHSKVMLMHDTRLLADYPPPQIITQGRTWSLLFCPLALASNRAMKATKRPNLRIHIHFKTVLI